MTSLEPLAVVLGAVIAAAGYGAGRRQAVSSGQLAGLGSHVEALHQRIETLDDALSDAMRQAVEGRERVAERCAALERRVPSEAEHTSTALTQVRERFERLEARLSGDCGLLQAEQERLDGRQTAVDQRLADVTGALERVEQRMVQQQTVWQQVDQELKQMQDFIVEAARDAAQQRQTLQAPSAVAGAEFSTMMQDLAVAQAEFMARRQQEAL